MRSIFISFFFFFNSTRRSRARLAQERAINLVLRERKRSGWMACLTAGAAVEQGRKKASAAENEWFISSVAQIADRPVWASPSDEGLFFFTDLFLMRPFSVYYAPVRVVITPASTM